jgi:hypothetical protein
VDTSVDNSGEATISFSIHDSWSLPTGTASPAEEKSAFGEIKSAGKYAHDQPGQKTTYTDISGIGTAAYTKDQTNSNDGAVVQYQDAVNVLRPARPYQFILQLNYVVPNSGQPIKDKSLDVALHDNSKRSAATSVFMIVSNSPA